MKYYVNDELVSEREFKSRLEDAIAWEVEAHYDDILDDDYEEVHIGCCTFTASQILRCCDPVAYNMGMQDYISYRLEDALSDFEVATENGFGADQFRTEDDDEEEVEEDDGNVVVHVYNYAGELIAASRVDSESEIKEALNKLDFCAGDTIEIEKEY